jgi:hypothetical protein
LQTGTHVCTQGFENRRTSLNIKLASVRYILPKVFGHEKPITTGFKIDHILPKNILYTPTTDEPITDDIIECLVNRIKIVHPDTVVDVPGLSLVDLGYRTSDLQSKKQSGPDPDPIWAEIKMDEYYEDNLFKDYETHEGHCLFFNIAAALFGEAKYYSRIRILFALIFNVISHLPVEHPLFTGVGTAEKLGWFYNNVTNVIPDCLLQFYVARDEEITEIPTV